MFEAYITNTALYPLMGIEVGTTVHFPTTTQELQAALAKIGIDGKRYSEVFFTSFDSDVLGLYDHLYECENIDELNELGHALLEVRDKGGLETFEAALVLGNHTRSVKDLINLTQNLDLYRFYPDISDDEGLGRLYADELGTIDIPEHIQNYFDYEAYGRDVRINEGGVFAPGGYVSAVPEGFKEYYHGPQDIPPEHRIFAYPEKAEPVHSILAALKRFQEAPPAPKKDKAGPSHEERMFLINVHRNSPSAWKDLNFPKNPVLIPVIVSFPSVFPHIDRFHIFIIPEIYHILHHFYTVSVNNFQFILRQKPSVICSPLQMTICGITPCQTALTSRKALIS